MMQSRPIYGMEMGDNHLCTTQYIAKKTLFLQKKKCLHVIIHSKLKLYCKEFCFCFFFYISSTAKYIVLFSLITAGEISTTTTSQSVQAFQAVQRGNAASVLGTLPKSRKLDEIYNLC